MKQLLFSAYAQDDLLKIARYIALDNPVRARSFVAELRKQCELTAQFSNIGVAKPEYAEGLRMLAYQRYLIFFSVTDDAVNIERVLHSARDLHQLFGLDK